VNAVLKLDELAALGGLATGPVFVSGLATGLTLAEAPFPRPGADVREVQRFFQGDAGAERINIAGQALSALSLAGFTVAAARLADRSGPRSKAVRAAALTGGALATASLLASATAAALLTGPAGRDRDKARTLHRLLFTLGGPVHGAGLALLMGALGVTGLRTGALPRPLTVASLTSAGVDALAPVVMVAPKAALLIPAGRFPTFAVLGAAGLRLARGGLRTS
jgi:hypothetical protein